METTRSTDTVEVAQTGFTTYSVRILSANGNAVTINSGMSRTDAEELGSRVRMAIASHLTTTRA